ncbi:ribonuclease P [Halostagnicola larsenii XH-48]|uniref:Ribonuclease P protein component 3 n=1 Tax=Halostagnicola larsenii XH-48 TaxID=797299 RepID=W0JQR2_9EURY|nr:RNase P subunit p30 family protein [Halostagnicola larsenii]AHF99302.1 ribonuclease P [Halostagnicola larsenii XH-48]
MYEGVHARPDGRSTVARLAKTAAEYGFEGVVVRSHDDSSGEYDAERIGEEYDVDVVNGVEIRADSPEQASGSVGNYRPSHTVLAIHGGTNEMNRFAVENEKVDVLAHPMRGGGDVNHVLVKAAAENGVRLEFNLGDVLRESGGQRVRTIQSLRKLREIVSYYDAPYVVSADPRSHLEVRAPRELTALGEQLGASAAWIERGLEEWRELAERNRAIQSDSFIEPGVKRTNHEKEH